MTAAAVYRVTRGSKFLNEGREILCSFQPILKETETRQEVMSHETFWFSATTSHAHVVYLYTQLPHKTSKWLTESIKTN